MQENIPGQSRIEMIKIIGTKYRYIGHLASSE